MNRLFTLLLVLCMVMAVPAQQKKTSSTKQKTATTKSVVAKKKTQTKPAAKAQKSKQTKAKQPVVTVQSLKNERQKIQKQIQDRKSVV